VHWNPQLTIIKISAIVVDFMSGKILRFSYYTKNHSSSQHVGNKQAHFDFTGKISINLTAFLAKRLNLKLGT
jgi:hypothetical protein